MRFKFQYWKNVRKILLEITNLPHVLNIRKIDNEEYLREEKEMIGIPKSKKALCTFFFFITAYIIT